MANDNTTGLEIFSQQGAVSQAVIGDQAFITIYKVDGASGSAGSDIKTLLASAPATAIKIQQRADVSITKALSNDFMVAAFGDTPTSIILNGINIIGINNCIIAPGSDDVTRMQILDFYQKYKVSSDPNVRFDISIASGAKQPAQAFRCVIVQLDVVNSNQNGQGTVHRMYDYTLSLVGVNKQNGAAK